MYDGSAKSAKNRPSVKDMIYKCKNRFSDLFEILLRFHFRNIVILRDVQKAFHHLRIHPVERNYVRFLWLIYLSQSVLIMSIRLLRFTRIAFRIVVSSFLLNATIQYHLDHKNQFTEQLKNGCLC